MFAIEFAYKPSLVANDHDEGCWTRMNQRYETEPEATSEMRWLELDDGGYAYRVVEVAA